MPIIASASETKNYKPAPEGVFHAVAVDVIDLGLVKSAFQDDKGNDKYQHKINIVWQIADTRDDGKRFQLYKRYTLSLHEKAALRHDLESWRGRAFTEQELKGFDVESIIGANCFVNVQHRKSADGTKTYANVVAVMPLPKGLKLDKLVAEDYQRPAAPASAVEPVTPEYAESVGGPDLEDIVPF